MKSETPSVVGDEYCYLRVLYRKKTFSANCEGRINQKGLMSRRERLYLFWGSLRLDQVTFEFSSFLSFVPVLGLAPGRRRPSQPCGKGFFSGLIRNSIIDPA